MIGDAIHVAIRSYKRAGRVKTLDVVPFGWLWVPESQAAEYRTHYGERVISIPDAQDGNLSRKNNTILDKSPCPWTLMLDDDISGIGCFEDGGHHWMTPSEIERMIVQGFVLADDLGVEFWGINTTMDALSYDTYEPFNLLCLVLGPFHGHLSPTLRYDESVLGKDDYDFWLQNIRAFHRTLRLNKYHYVHNHGSMAGGFVSRRTRAVEAQGVQRLVEKWGSKVIVRTSGMSGGKSAKGGNILNTRVHVPIAGC